MERERKGRGEHRKEGKGGKEGSRVPISKNADGKRKISED